MKNQKNRDRQKGRTNRTEEMKGRGEGRVKQRESQTTKTKLKETLRHILSINIMGNPKGK